MGILAKLVRGTESPGGLQAAKQVCFLWLTSRKCLLRPVLEQDSVVAAKLEVFAQGQSRMNDGRPQVAPAVHAGTRGNVGGEDLWQRGRALSSTGGLPRTVSQRCSAPAAAPP